MVGFFMCITLLLKEAVSWQRVEIVTHEMALAHSRLYSRSQPSPEA